MLDVTIVSALLLTTCACAQTPSASLAALGQASYASARDGLWRAIDRSITGGYATAESTTAPAFAVELGSTHLRPAGAALGLATSNFRIASAVSAHRVNSAFVAGLAIGHARADSASADAWRLPKLNDQSITAFANSRAGAAYVNGKFTMGRVESLSDRRWRSSLALAGGYDFSVQKSWLVGPTASLSAHQALPNATSSRQVTLGARVASTDLYVKPFARVAAVWSSGGGSATQDRRWFQVAAGVQAKVADAWVLGASVQTDLARKDARLRSLLLSGSRAF
jgi:hypothetical protein